MVKCLKCDGFGFVYKGKKRETCPICIGKGVI